MIAYSQPIKAVCLCLSVTLIIAVGQLGTSLKPVELEGGGEAMQARIGSSFADMVAGTLSAENTRLKTKESTQTPPTTQRVPPELVEQMETTETTAPTESSEAQPVSVESTSQSAATSLDQNEPANTAVEAVKPKPVLGVPPGAVDRLKTTERLAPVPSAETQMVSVETLAPVALPLSLVTETQRAAPQVTAAARPLSNTATQTPPLSVTSQAPVQPITPSQTQATLKATEPQTLITAALENGTPATTLRPQRRVSEKATKVAAARPKTAAPEPKKSTTKLQQQAKLRAQVGNAKSNNTQGAEAGSKMAKAAALGTSLKKISQSGNAAASNYPGHVMRRIARVPKPRVNNRGTAMISFSVSSNGGLAEATVARSSGSARLDQAALRVVLQAAPFPRPPEGAQRRFSIRIKGR